MNVAILGASNKPDRYSNQALRLLAEHGHTVYPVHPALADIEGHRVYRTLADIPDPIDTITLYVSAALSGKMIEAILEAKPRRVIFNPGTENPELEQQLSAAGVATPHACTLVMLRTGQFS
ncbi:MAG: CoA-binding protein [Lentisphaerae bacterium]|jgi:predicted CoA-binding protein|nr:CoA-binding protein [Lentisphaerota bacterium]